MNGRRRVVISGLGIISPIGNDIPTNSSVVIRPIRRPAVRWWKSRTNAPVFSAVRL